MCMGVLFLAVCLFDLACFFLLSFSSLIKTCTYLMRDEEHVYMFVYLFLSTINDLFGHCDLLVQESYPETGVGATRIPFRLVLL